MSSLKAALLALAVLGALLSGCASEPAGRDRAPAADPTRLARHVALALDDANEVPDGLGVDEHLAQRSTVAFEYTHAGPPMAVAGAMVRYQTAASVERIEALSKFTGKAELRSGDVVRIEVPAGIASPIAVEVDGRAVSERAGAPRPWMTLAGNPLPVATRAAGAATWDLASSYGIDFDLSGLSLSQPPASQCTPAGCVAADLNSTYHVLRLRLAQTAVGSMSVSTEPSGADTNLAVRLPQLKSDVQVDLAVNATIGGEMVDMAVKGQMHATIDAKTDLLFNATRELRQVSQAEHVVVDWDLEHHGFKEDLPPQGHMDRDFPYLQQPLAFGRHTDATLDALLRGLWALDLQVGDTYRFSLRAEDGDMAYASQVVLREDRAVGAGTRPAFKVVDTLSGNLTLGAGPRAFRYESTYWVDAQSSLLLHAQGEWSQALAPADVAALRDAMGQALPGGQAEFPAAATVATTTTFTLSLSGHSGDLGVPALASVGAGRMLPLVALQLLKSSAEEAAGLPLDG